MIASHTDRVLADGANRETKLYCHDRQLGGFPFHMALSCSSAGLTVANESLSANLAGLEIVALAYRPQHVIADLTAPLDVSWSGAAPVIGNWSAGRTSVRMANQTLARFSAEFDDLLIASGIQSAASARSEFHVQAAGTNETDIAFSAADSAISIATETSALFSINATMRAGLPPDILLGGQFNDRTVSISDLQVRLSAGDSRISATGGIEIGRSGLANGEIVVVTENLEALAGFLQALPTPIRSQTQTFVGGMIAYSKPAKSDQGVPVSELTLSIRNNGIYAGTRKIGELAPGS